MGMPFAANKGPCKTGGEQGNGKPDPPDPDGTVPGSPAGPVSPGTPDATRIPTRSVGMTSTYGLSDPTLITPETGDSPDDGCQGGCELKLAATWAGVGECTPGTEFSLW